MSDLGNANWSETDASNNAAVPNGWPEGMNPSDVNNAARANMGAIKRFWDRANGVKTTAGTSTAYTLSYDVAAASYYDGEEFSFILDETCGATPTLNINALGARNLRKFSAGAWTNLAASDLLTDQPVRVRYNLAADKFDVLYPPISFTINVSTSTFYGAMQPQGRLTLSTGVAVPVANVTGATSIYFTPFRGNLVPLYDGTGMKWTPFTELTNTTTDNTKNPAAMTTNSNYDLFVWSDSGTLRLGRGPAWTSDTGRGTGAGTTELELVNGLYVNKIAITNGAAAQRGTYVGTVRSDGSSQCNWHVGAVAASGTAALLCVWNAYNRADIRGLIGDTTDSWSYSTATIRPANNSSTMRVSCVIGLQEDFFFADYRSQQSNTNQAQGGYAGIGYDSTTVFSGRNSLIANPGSVGDMIAIVEGDHAVQPLGFHYFQALEKSTGTGTSTWYGDSAATLQTGLRYIGTF